MGLTTSCTLLLIGFLTITASIYWQFYHEDEEIDGMTTAKWVFFIGSVMGLIGIMLMWTEIFTEYY